jgi:hypothetical protein
MKPSKVCHQFGIGCIGKEKDEPEGLHEVSVSEDDDAPAGIFVDEATDCFAGAIEECDK